MNILDEICLSDAFKTIDIRKMEPNYGEAAQRLCNIEKQLLEQFPECSEILNSYQSSYMELTNISNRHEFKSGFRSGALMMIELLLGADR